MDARSRGGLGSRRGRYEEDAAKKAGGDAGFFIGSWRRSFFLNRSGAWNSFGRRVWLGGTSVIVGTGKWQNWPRKCADQNMYSEHVVYLIAKVLIVFVLKWGPPKKISCSIVLQQTCNWCKSLLIMKSRGYKCNK